MNIFNSLNVPIKRYFINDNFIKNGIVKLFDSENEARKKAKLKKLNDFEIEKVRINNTVKYQVLTPVMYPPVEKFNRNIYVFNGELKELSGPIYIKDDIYYIFKEFPETKFINFSNFSVDFFVDVNLASCKEMISPEILKIRENLAKQGREHYALAMSNSNIFSCMIDENKEKQELINDIMKG
jgi:hypothetical protein